MNYSKGELVNMVHAIREAHGNCLLASRIYKANHSNLQQYSRNDCFEKLKARFERVANANYEKATRTHEASNENSQITIGASVVENSNINSRQLSNQIGVPKSLASKLLNKKLVSPLPLRVPPSLSNLDMQNRLQFCDWAEEKILIQFL